MNVERPAAKKSLAVTLALALGLSLPGSAWSQYSTRVVAVTPVVGAPSVAAVAGVRTLGSLVPSLPVGVLSASAVSPVLSAPVASHVAAMPASASVIPAVAKAAAAPSEAASSLAQLDSVSRAAAETSAGTGGVDAASIGRVFDGSTQQRMLRSLYQVASVFAEQYAPLDMKKERFQLDLKREYDKAKAAVLADPALTTRGFQDILAGLTASMRDYHVSISFNSTESSNLPFQVMGAEGKYFLAHIDREKLPETVFPFQQGDEVVAFDGRPTVEAVKDIAAKMTGNTPQTDMRLAEMFLTNRRRARGDQAIPKGKVQLIIRSKGVLSAVTMPWTYTPELVAPDVPARNAGLLEPAGFDAGTPAAGPVSGGFFSTVSQAFSAAVHPLIDIFTDIRADASDNAFLMGARKSFVPRLGEILWQSEDDSHFDAYIFKTNDGRKMGYIRIAAYDGENEEVQEFAKVMAKFQAETEALVIDQVSNPGGNLFYLYALASHLTDKPLVAPRHRLIIGENEAHQSAEFLLKLIRDSKKSPEAREKEADKAKAKAKDETPNISGYPLTGKFMAFMAISAKYIVTQFKAGLRFTGLTHISGVADIDPAPKEEERFTKPILLLTNALDFSGGDFFPAIMQDNQRATIMGVRTAGAGGIVRPFAAGGFGIARLSATVSLAQRANGQPIENLGVTPEIPYEITARDLRTGFAQYRYSILKALNGLLDPAK